MIHKMLTNEAKKDLYRINITALAKRIGRTRTWVSLVVHGRKKSPATQRLIAEALGESVKDLWPNDKKAA